METDLTQLLPEDVLVDVLRLLPPHSLAAARCVRKAWHAAIDARRLLGLVPRSLAGIFINFHDYYISEFFSHPSPEGAAINCKLNYITEDNDVSYVADHCNGLLLLDGLVVNPATRSRVTLPPRPPSRVEYYNYYNFLDEDFIVFDPILSSHFEVFIIPCIRYRPNTELDTTIKEQEWPPSLFTVDVFSSVTSKWEERSFVRQGGAIGTIADIQQVWQAEEQYSVYWRGELYVHCHFVMRFSLSDCTYQVLKPPKDIDLGGLAEHHLGRSENGVYFASLDGHNYRLRVWILKESCGQTEWVLKHDNYLDHAKPHRNYNQHIHGPWVLQDMNYEIFKGISGLKNVIDKLKEYNYKVGEYDGCISILGFHPFKEIVFLSKSLKRGLAYDLNTSKLEDMGNLYPKHYDYFAYFEKIQKSFPYTPCWIGGAP